MCAQAIELMTSMFRTDTHDHCTISSYHNGIFSLFQIVEYLSDNLQKELYAKRLNREAFFKIDQRQGVPSYPPFLITSHPEVYTF
jgi:hypothetical protein